jgi:predicted nucleic acid-binding protein
LIAATAMENGAELMTLDTKDFQYIDGLRLYKLPLDHH